jgi:hypothetical protein
VHVHLRPVHRVAVCLSVVDGQFHSVPCRDADAHASGDRDAHREHQRYSYGHSLPCNHRDAYGDWKRDTIRDKDREPHGLWHVNASVDHESHRFGVRVDAHGVLVNSCDAEPQHYAAET